LTKSLPQNRQPLYPSLISGILIPMPTRRRWKDRLTPLDVYYLTGLTKWFTNSTTSRLRRLQLWKGGNEMSAIVTAEYKTFFKEIKERIHKAQYDALKAVNKELINLYWDIGKSIVAKQEKLGWGKAIVETLAQDLQKEFPGIQGFSVQNLWNMRQFYSAYKDNSKL